jgi:hypothetical protein
MSALEAEASAATDLTRARRAVATLLFFLTFGPMACSRDSRFADPIEKARAAVKKAGGNFEHKLGSDGIPRVKVDLAARNVGDNELDVLNGIAHLDSLILRGTAVTDAGMASLKPIAKLRCLNLDDCAITDLSLAQLRDAASLRGLYLAGTKVTDAGLAYLHSLSKLRALGLRGTQVTDAGLVHLRGLTELRELDLQSTRVSDAGVARLRKEMPQVRIAVDLGARPSTRSL